MFYSSEGTDLIRPGMLPPRWDYLETLEARAALL